MSIATQALYGFNYSTLPSAPPHDGHHDHGLARNRAADVAQKKVIREGLVELGVPRGLAEQLAEDDLHIGKRIYLLDNSGSMSQNDGHVLLDVGKGRVELLPSTRWEETCAFAREHARWNLAMGVPCEFMVLNCAGRSHTMRSREGLDFVCLHDARDLQDLERLLQFNPPRGVTPIAARLADIRSRIQAEAQELAARGQMIFLTIATDGMPTSSLSGTSLPSDRKNLVTELRRLCSQLPVQLVIRLCTDDASVVKFYDALDDELELPIDVLDDLGGEARQIASRGNDWFVYSPLLHRIREAGTLCKLLDSIDEKRLTKRETRQLVELLSTETAPMSLSSHDDRSFVREASNLARGSAPVFDILTGQMRPSVDRLKLQRALQVRGLLSACFPCLG